jgi:hypothetical protein
MSIATLDAPNRPLELTGPSASDAPAFFGGIEHAFYNIVGCGPNVITAHADAPELADTGRTSLTDLLAVRERHIG